MYSILYFCVGFCYDDACFKEVAPIMDDVRIENYNVQSNIARFIDAILVEQNQSVGNNIMLKMGFDFHYQNARIWYVGLIICY